MYVNYAFYEKKTKNIAAITIIIGLLNITLNYLLIPHFGYIAAAWTTLISYISLFILHYINVKYVININKTTDIKIFVLPVIILSFIGVLIYYITTVEMDYGISLAIRLLLFALITLLTLKTLIKPGTR
jgi:O-antigen/teichoic acid export membrane protein